MAHHWYKSVQQNITNTKQHLIVKYSTVQPKLHFGNTIKWCKFLKTHRRMFFIRSINGYAYGYFLISIYFVLPQITKKIIGCLNITSDPATFVQVLMFEVLLNNHIMFFFFFTSNPTSFNLRRCQLILLGKFKFMQWKINIFVRNYCGFGFTK